jgi:hypothetical protein
LGGESNVSDGKGDRARADIIFQSLPQMIRESLTEEQTAALRVALTEKPWRDHSVDLRISVPIPYRPFT